MKLPEERPFYPNIYIIALYSNFIISVPNKECSLESKPSG